MKVKVVGGKIYLPKEVRDKVGDSDEYELIVVGDQIILRPRLPEKLNLENILKKPVVKASVEEMVEAEDIDVD